MTHRYRFYGLGRIMQPSAFLALLLAASVSGIALFNASASSAHGCHHGRCQNRRGAKGHTITYKTALVDADNKQVEGSFTMRYRFLGSKLLPTHPGEPAKKDARYLVKNVTISSLPMSCLAGGPDSPPYPYTAKTPQVFVPVNEVARVKWNVTGYLPASQGGTKFVNWTEPAFKVQGGAVSASDLETFSFDHTSFVNVRAHLNQGEELVGAYIDVGHPETPSAPSFTGGATAYASDFPSDTLCYSSNALVAKKPFRPPT